MTLKIFWKTDTDHGHYILRFSFRSFGHRHRSAVRGGRRCTQASFATCKGSRSCFRGRIVADALTRESYCFHRRPLRDVPNCCELDSNQLSDNRFGSLFRTGGKSETLGSTLQRLSISFSQETNLVPTRNVWDANFNAHLLVEDIVTRSFPTEPYLHDLSSEEDQCA